MAKNTKKVIVAMSGGVDSSVSAALLKEAGFSVEGVFMKCWNVSQYAESPCSAEEDERWARRAAARIGIPFYSIDLVKEYKEKVVDYFVLEYKAGRTPNPDVMCNREIKFGVFYDWAVSKFGADYIATGHYARNIHNVRGQIRVLPPLRPPLSKGGNGGVGNKKSFVRLLKGVDPNKDQSYFLWAVPENKFKNVLFPVGGYLKTEVRALARKFDLPNAERKDSQGICFIGKVDVGNFLKEYIGDKPGDIVNVKGASVGRHDGLHFYTVGQRRGINIGGGPPYYIAQKDYAANTLIVAREYDEELFGDSLVASNINWISSKPDLPFSCHAKIRYRQKDQDATIKKEDENGNFVVEFKELQRAITPGQSVVFYKKDELMGGGVIN